jgi:hypothetical protein
MGIWGSLARIGGFAASLIPGVGPVASALLNIGGAAAGEVLDSKGRKVDPTKTKSANERDARYADINAELQNLDKLDASGESFGELRHRGTALYDKGGAGIDTSRETAAPVKGYYNTLLNGSREATASLLQPEVSTVLGQYDTAMDTVREFAGRGGGRNRTLAEMPTMKVGAYGKALQGVRPQAAEGLAKAAESEASLGLQEAGLGLGTMTQGIGGSADIAKAKQAGRQDLLRTKYGDVASQRSADQADKQAGRQLWSDLGLGAGRLITDIITRKK